MYKFFSFVYHSVPQSFLIIIYVKDLLIPLIPLFDLLAPSGVGELFCFDSFK